MGNPLKTTLLQLLIAAVVASAPAARAGEAAPAKPRGPEVIYADAARVLEAVRQPGASVVLVNVWATWCLPCRKEFPDLMRVYRELAPQGMRLVLVSADFDDDRETTVKEFLRARGVDFPSYLKDQGDQEFIDGLDPRWSGALPVSLWFDKNGVVKEIREGDGTYKQLLNRTKSVLGSSTPRKEAK